jgi:hypothetical protein
MVFKKYKMILIFDRFWDEDLGAVPYNQKRSLFYKIYLTDRPHCATLQAASCSVALSAVALQPLRNVNKKIKKCPQSSKNHPIRYSFKF